MSVEVLPQQLVPNGLAGPSIGNHVATPNVNGDSEMANGSAEHGPKFISGMIYPPPDMRSECWVLCLEHIGDLKFVISDN